MAAGSMVFCRLAFSVETGGGLEILNSLFILNGFHLRGLGLDF